MAFGPRPPFGGIPGTLGGNSSLRPEGGEHNTVFTDGAHVSWDQLGGKISGLHGWVHDATGGGQDLPLTAQDLRKRR